MKLTQNICNLLLSSFTPSRSKEAAIKRLFELCSKFDTNLHILNWVFDGENISQIDETYRLILSN